MDWKYLYSVLSFIVGVLSGFQGIHERYKKDSDDAAFTVPGLAYLFSRGLVPAVIFIALYSSYTIDNPLILSVTCGVGAEIILRTKLYIKKEQQGDRSDDLLRGPFDLLRWYQTRCLEVIAYWIAASRKEFVNRHLPEGAGFLVLCDRVLENLQAFPDPRDDIIVDINELKNKFAEEMLTDNAAVNLERKYCVMLGYKILNLAGKRGFRILLTS
jgi:hypothetical protein